MNKLQSLPVTNFTIIRNVNCEDMGIIFPHYPLRPLDISAKMYSYAIQELNADLEPGQRDPLLNKTMVMPGFERVQPGDMQLGREFIPQITALMYS